MHLSRFDAALAVVALVAVLLPTYSQSSPMTFERTYGGPGTDMGNCVQQTADGGYIVTGLYDALSDSVAGYLVRTDAYGDTVWTNMLGGSWVQQTTDGGFVVVGGVDSGVWLAKTDADGETLWTRIYPGNNAARTVEQTADGGFVMAGTASYSSPGGGDVYVIKTDARGDTLWTRTYGGPATDEGISIQQTSDHGYVVAATTMSFGAGGQDIWIIRTDSVGDTLWTRTFGGDSIDYGGSAQQTSDGGYMVFGWTFSYSASPQFYLIKTNGSGDTLWTRVIGGPGWVEALAGEQVADGGYIMVGVCGTGLPDVYLVRTDPTGDTLWTRTFGGSDFDAGYCVRQTADGGYIVCGQTYSFGAGESDFYLIKTDQNGNVGVAESTTSPSRKPVLSVTCAPNPFSASTRISFSAADSGPLALSVCDVQGRLVRTLAVNRQSSTVWGGRDDAGRLLPSGTYLVRCANAGRHATARLVLQR